MNHYRTFKAIIPHIDAKRMSDIVKMEHHDIVITTLTPAYRILEAARQLKMSLDSNQRAH